jgi:hypothetical protein
MALAIVIFSPGPVIFDGLFDPALLFIKFFLGGAAEGYAPHGRGPPCPSRPPDYRAISETYLLFWPLVIYGSSYYGGLAGSRGLKGQDPVPGFY